jgi:hypothetical protein
LLVGCYPAITESSTLSHLFIFCGSGKAPLLKIQPFCMAGHPA